MSLDQKTLAPTVEEKEILCGLQYMSLQELVEFFHKVPTSKVRKAIVKELNERSDFHSDFANWVEWVIKQLQTHRARTVSVELWNDLLGAYLFRSDDSLTERAINFALNLAWQDDFATNSNTYYKLICNKFESMYDHNIKRERKIFSDFPLLKRLVLRDININFSPFFDDTRPNPCLYKDMSFALLKRLMTRVVLRYGDYDHDLETLVNRILFLHQKKELVPESYIEEPWVLQGNTAFLQYVSDRLLENSKVTRKAIIVKQ
ncbi:MAG: hypothetical protein WCW02_04800 [Candidatus Buchananbacteria bacterium]